MARSPAFFRSRARAVAAAVSSALAGALPGLLRPSAGVFGLGAIAEPRAFLAELARRGIRVHLFAPHYFTITDVRIHRIGVSEGEGIVERSRSFCQKAVNAFVDAIPGGTTAGVARGTAADKKGEPGAGEDETLKVGRVWGGGRCLADPQCKALELIRGHGCASGGLLGAAPTDVCFLAAAFHRVVRPNHLHPKVASRDEASVNAAAMATLYGEPLARLPI